MKFAIILNSNEPETVWNAFRFGNKAIEAGHKVTTFLMGSGVEATCLPNIKFNVPEAVDTFIKTGGTILACESCLKVRKQDATACSVSRMPQLVELVADSDRVISF
jgi:uncharacterized protein involved in oxidation of intracellular sulfur